MFKCECGRKFTTLRGRSYHKNFCGKKKISLDGGYEYFIDEEGKRKYIHHDVMENILERKLKENEIVHHKDENKRNNDPSNLKLTDKTKHAKHHYNKKDQIWKDQFKLMGIKNSPPPPIYKGSKHPNSKLTEDDVKNIKTRLFNGEKQIRIAKEFHVDRTTIRDIKNGTNWKHVTI